MITVTQTASYFYHRRQAHTVNLQKQLRVGVYHPLRVFPNRYEIKHDLSRFLAGCSPLLNHTQNIPQELRRSDRDIIVLLIGACLLYDLRHQRFFLLPHVKLRTFFLQSRY